MSNQTMSLRNILHSDQNEDQPVAFTGNRSVSRLKLKQEVAGLRERVNAVDVDRWILYTNDAYPFLLGLMALLHGDATIVLPPDDKQGILSFCADNANAALTDEAIEGISGIDSEQHLHIRDPESLSDEHASPSFSRLDPDRTRIEMFTSGTSGERTTVKKNLSHLQQDIEAEEMAFGEQTRGSIVMGTVSHQHLYGMLMRVLWPFCAGHPFYSPPLAFPEDLSTAIQETAAKEVAFITSPAHLKAFARSEVFRERADVITSIYSGGGFISDEISEEVREKLEFYPLDVFGTTETGGIAWRPANEERWRTFQNVTAKVDEEGQLLISSPAVSMTDDWYATGDHAEAQDGTFELKGRMDRVIKVAETRLSLHELEQQMAKHPAVDEAVAVVCNPDAPEHERKRLGAAVVPKATEDDLDQDDLWTDLRESLKDFFPTVCLPKRWERLEELPKDHLGKVQYDEVRENFSS